MKTLIALVLVIAVGVPFVGKKQAVDRPAGPHQQVLDALPGMIESRQVTSVRIFYLPPDVKAVPSSALEREARVVLEVRDLIPGPMFEDLRDLTEGLIGDPQQGDYVVSWGVEFRTRRGVLTTIYMGDQGNAGAVGDTPVRFRDVRLRDWLKKRFSKSFN